MKTKGLQLIRNITQLYYLYDKMTRKVENKNDEVGNSQAKTPD